MQCHNAELELAVISGDFNWDEQVSRSSDLLQTLQMSWKDGWMHTESVQLRNGNEGYTFDCIQNPWLNGDRRGRLDRILIKSSTWNPEGAVLIGENEIPNAFIEQEVLERGDDGFSTPRKTIRKIPAVASDHYGLVVSLCSSSN